MDSFQVDNFLYAWPAVKGHFDLVKTSLKRKQVTGALPCAKITVEILRAVVGTCKFTSTQQLMNVIRAVGSGLLQASSAELSIGNIVKRFLFLIREEYANKIRQNAKDSTSSNTTKPARKAERNNNVTDENIDVNIDSLTLNSLKRSDSASNVEDQPSITRVLSEGLTISDRSNDDSETQEFTKLFPDIRQTAIASLTEINEELDNLTAPISEQAQDQVHADEWILVFGYSTIVESFLKAAAKKRKFQVIIAEASPSQSGLKLANSLSKTSNISTTLIPDSNIYAIMSRVNKVILAPHAVMIDGGCMCTAGHLMVAVAAREFSVPVICLAGVYIMTPLFAHNQRVALNHLLSPASILPYDAAVNFDDVEVFVPAYDHLSPDLVDLYVTNNGSHQPSYVYRLLSELYHTQDYTF